MRYLILVLLPFPAYAAPFLTTDPSPQNADRCVYQVTGGPVVDTPCVGGAFKVDLAGFPAGTTNMQLWFRHTLWGVESTKVPFAFAKPEAGGPGPANVRLTP